MSIFEEYGAFNPGSLLRQLLLYSVMENKISMSKD